MDWPAVIAKIAGAVLLAMTIRSIVKHFRLRTSKQGQTAIQQQARSEEFLNNLILYLWHAFMVAFSIGLMVNN